MRTDDGFPLTISLPAGPLGSWFPNLGRSHAQGHRREPACRVSREVAGRFGEVWADYVAYTLQASSRRTSTRSSPSSGTLDIPAFERRDQEEAARRARTAAAEAPLPQPNSTTPLAEALAS